MTAAMPVPAVDGDAAWRAAGRLRQAARLAGEALEALAEVRTPAWSGTAAQEWYGVRAALSRHVTTAAETSAAAGSAVGDYAAVAGPALRAMRAAGVELDAAATERMRLLGAGGPVDGAAERVAVAWRRYGQAEEDYRAGVATAAARLAALTDAVEDRPLDGWDHSGAGLRRFVRDGVTDPARSVWDLTGGAVTDPGRWWATVSAMPGHWVDQARDPLGTAADVFAVEEFRAGRFGEGVGAVLAGVVGARRLRGLVPAPEEVRRRFAGNMARPDAPRPRTQTFEEMLDRVDLSRSEHYGLGHALRRHVDVDDAYLQDRLVHGTLQDEGTRGHRPAAASAWHSLDVAEEVITATLRRHEPTVRVWLAGGKDQLRLQDELVDPVGRVMRRDGDSFSTHDGRGVAVTLRRAADGIYVHTAFVTEAKR